MTTPADGLILTQEDLAQLRHTLRTPISQVVAQAELLLQERACGDNWACKAAMDQALFAAREALTYIESCLPSKPGRIDGAALHLLRTALSNAHDRIHTSTAAVLGARPPVVDDQVRGDIVRMRTAADQLVMPLTGIPNLSPVISTIFEPLPRKSGPWGEAPETSQGGRVLVVDDTEQNRRLLERSLTRVGYTVVTAPGGSDALARVAAAEFDVILLDVMMPDMDGRTVLQRLKESPATHDIPVLMISALSEVDTAVECIELGADDYITKPYSLALLYARVMACVERSRRRRSEVQYLRAVQLLTDAARSVEDGHYGRDALAEVARRDDELGGLARVFDTMAAQVQAREALLVDRYRALREDIRTVKPETVESASVTDELAVGTVVSDRYTIVRLIGRGGWGTVYEAEDGQLAERIALKALMPARPGAAEIALERFKSEIRHARRISHENVVRTHDFGESDGLVYVTMELVEGITVRHLLENRRRLGVASTLAIGTQLARALDAAHRQGVIHRDVKPENILLDANGIAKVMDFGIAQFSQRPSRLTESGTTLGTPEYMAPEQLLEDPVDERTDLYSAGVVLFECLTGRPPHQAQSAIALVAKILVEPCPDPASLADDIPPALSAIVLSLLAREKNDRPPSAARLLELLTPLA